MGLDELIRFGVATADFVTKSLQANVTHAAWIGSGVYGEPSYASAVTRPALVEYKQRLRKTSGGQEVMQQASVIFIGPITANGAAERREPVDPRDQIFLPNGYTGPILSVEGAIDPSTNSLYTVEVILG